MKRKDELLQRAQRDLEAFVEERLGLEQELTQRQQTLTQQRQTLTQQAQTICAQTQRLEELQAMSTSPGCCA